MVSANKRIFFKNFVFEVCSNVYEPSEDSFLFAENLRIKKNAYVLDMGTGSGILGIIASTKAKGVLAIDINPDALMCARQNAVRNGSLGKMTFLRARLFSSLKMGTKFDAILFNAPYLPSRADEEKTWLTNAWSGGPTGREIVDSFILQAPNYIDSSGEILLLHSNLTNLEQTLLNFRNQGLSTEIAATLKLPFFETLFLIRAFFTNKRSV
jgi:release factor glutamine methyltransferase